MYACEEAQKLRERRWISWSGRRFKVPRFGIDFVRESDAAVKLEPIEYVALDKRGKGKEQAEEGLTQEIGLNGVLIGSAEDDDDHIGGDSWGGGVRPFFLIVLSFFPGRADLVFVFLMSSLL